MEPYRAGNDEEFDEIVREYVNDIRKIVYTYVKNHHTMEDITQEVFGLPIVILANFEAIVQSKLGLLK